MQLHAFWEKGETNAGYFSRCSHARAFNTSGAASSSRIQVTKDARSVFGGVDLPACLKNAAFTVWLHWLDGCRGGERICCEWHPFFEFVSVSVDLAKRVAHEASSRVV